jgi:hypothetical protein
MEQYYTPNISAPPPTRTPLPLKKSRSRYWTTTM